MAPRPGRAQAAPSLGRPVGLAARLQRGSLIGWSAGMLVTGVAYGSIADSIDDLVGDNDAMADMLARAGNASLTDSYLATSFRILALIGTGFAIGSVLRLRSEETAGRAEPLLAASVSRQQWAASHLTLAFGGSVVMLLAGGLATALSYGIVAGDLGAAPRLLGAALAYTPAMWLLVGLTATLVGFAPRWVAAAWAFLAVCFVIGMLGDLLGLPRWLIKASPFEHVPLLPAVDLTVTPLLVLGSLAAGLTAAGLAGLRRRDIG